MAENRAADRIVGEIVTAYQKIIAEHGELDANALLRIYQEQEGIDPTLFPHAIERVVTVQGDSLLELAAAQFLEDGPLPGLDDPVALVAVADKMRVEMDGIRRKAALMALMIGYLLGREAGRAER